MDAAMGMMGLGITLTLRDRASSAIDKLREKMTGLRDVSEQMVRRFDAGVKQMMGGLGMMYAGGKMLSAVNNAVGASVTVAASLEQAMARVGAVSGAVGKDFEDLSAQAKQLGRDTQFSASDAANAQELLARGGFKTRQIIAALPEVLNMAAAEGMGLAEAADIAVSTLNAFGMEASRANEVANVLAAASSSTNTSISTLGESFKYAAPGAKMLGIRIQEAAAMIGAMGDSGIKGSMAGTALDAALKRLATAPKQARDALASLGVQIKKSNGDFIGMESVMNQIYESMTKKGLGNLEQEEMMAKIFGGDAAKGMIAVMNSVVSKKNAELVKQYDDATANQVAKKMADRMNDTLEGAMKRLESASEGLSIAIGSIFKDSYRWAIEKLADFKGWLTGLIEDFPFLSKLIIGGTGALVAFAGAALVAGGALVSIGGAIKLWPMVQKTIGLGLNSIVDMIPPLRTAVTMFQDFRSWGWSVGQSFRMLGIYAKDRFIAALKAIPGIIKGAFKALWALPGPIKLLIGLGAALVAAWKTNFAGIRDMATAVSEGWKLAMSANAEGIAEMDAETAARLKKAGLFDAAVNMSAVFWRIRQFWEGFVEGFSRGVDRIKSIFAAIADALTPAIDTGKAALEFLGILSPVAESASATWRDVGMAIGDSVVTVLSVIAAVKTVSAVVKAWTAAQWLLNSATFAWPGTWIILGIMGLVAAGYYLYKNWDTVKKKLIVAWDWVWNKVKSFWEWLKSKFTWDAVIATWESVKQNVASGWEWVKGKVQGFWNWLKSFFTWDVVLDTWEYVKGAVAEGWEWIKGLFTWEWLSGAWQGLVDAWDRAKSLVEQGWESLKGSIVGEWATNAWGTLTSAWDTASDAISSGWGLLTGQIKIDDATAAAIWNGVAASADAAWSGIQKSWDIAQGMVSSSWNALKDSFLGDWAAGAWDTLKSGWEGAKGLISSGWDTLKNSFLGDWAAGAWDGLVGAWDWAMGNDPAAREKMNDQDVMAAQVRDVTMLNKMSAGFADRVAEMSAAWEPFKASLGSGFNLMFDVMTRVGDNIKNTVIPAVNDLVSALSRVASELGSISQAANINVKVNVPQPQAPVNFGAFDRGQGVKAHALGGIFSTPHLGVVAEAGPEAVVPISKPSLGIPILSAAAGAMGMSVIPSDLSDSMPAFASLPAPPPNETPAAPYLAQMARNQAAFQGEATARATSGDAEKPVKVENKLDVEVKAVTTPVYLDGSLIGEFFTSFQAHESMRMGVPVTP